MTTHTTQEKTMQTHDDATRIEAKSLATRTIEGMEPMSWRDAGYDTALEAATVLVGDSGDTVVDQLAAEIVAAKLTE